MSRKHDVDRRRAIDSEDALQDVHDKIHGSDVVVMDEDPIKRLELGLLLRLFEDLNFGGNL